jgi:hypothetical protein
VPAPGISGFSADIIWQPLQTPSEKLSGRAKNAANCSRSAGLNRIDLAQPSPAPSTSPYENPPHATTPLKRSSVVRPAIRSVMCTSLGRKPARSNAAAISSWLLTPCSRRIAISGRAPLQDVRCGDVLGRIVRQRGKQAGILGIERLFVLFCAHAGLSRSACSDNWSRTTPRAVQCASHRSTAAPVRSR